MGEGDSERSNKALISRDKTKHTVAPPPEINQSLKRIIRHIAHSPPPLIVYLATKTWMIFTSRPRSWQGASALPRFRNERLPCTMAVVNTTHQRRYIRPAIQPFRAPLSIHASQTRNAQNGVGRIKCA
ncbi:unnamed protein product [Ectocarpus sp. 8 AP-2014]